MSLYMRVCVHCAYGTMIVFAVFNELQLSVAMPSHISSIACNIILHLLSFSPPMAHDVIQASRLASDLRNIFVTSCLFRLHGYCQSDKTCALNGNFVEMLIEEKRN